MIVWLWTHCIECHAHWLAVGGAAAAAVAVAEDAAVVAVGIDKTVGLEWSVCLLDWI